MRSVHSLLWRTQEHANAGNYEEWWAGHASEEWFHVKTTNVSPTGKIQIWTTFKLRGNLVIGFGVFCSPDFSPEFSQLKNGVLQRMFQTTCTSGVSELYILPIAFTAVP